jgi:DNA-binding NarL/FixJ family response regulator
MNQAIRLLLVDDHKIVTESMSLLLSTNEDLKIVGIVESGKEALRFLAENDVDVVISDLVMPEMSGIDLCIKVRQEFPTVKVLILTMVDDSIQIREAITAGVNGYVLKFANGAELFGALRTISTGRKYFSDLVVQALARGGDSQEGLLTIKGPGKLTLRELEVLRLIAQEHSTSDIAGKLCIGLATAESHRRNLIQKLGVKGTVGLVLYAVKHHII